MYRVHMYVRVTEIRVHQQFTLQLPVSEYYSVPDSDCQTP